MYVRYRMMDFKEFMKIKGFWPDFIFDDDFKE